MVQFRSTCTNRVWNFPLRPLAPPAPSRSCGCPSQSQRPRSGRLSAQHGAGGKAASMGALQEATTPHQVSSSAQAALPSEASFSLFFLFFFICGACGHQNSACYLFPTDRRGSPLTPVIVCAHLGPSPPPELASCPTHCPEPSPTQLASARCYGGKGGGERQGT